MHQTKTYSLFYPVRDKEYLTVFSGEKIARQNNDLNWWGNFDQSTNSMIGFDRLA